MKILILGAGGFLGQAVSARLAKEGHDLTCLHRSQGPLFQHGNIRYLRAELDDPRTLTIATNEAQFILDFAWSTTPGKSIGRPTLEVEDNLLPLSRLLEGMNTPTSCPLIFVSSAGATYVAKNGSQATETSAVRPGSYYGAAKLAAEMLLRAYSAQTANPVIVVRPSNVYGPGQMPRQQFGVVPTILQSLKHGTTFQIWGDGETARDFLFIDDFTDFFVKVICEEWQGFDLFNLASEHLCSINTLCMLLEQISGMRLTRDYVPSRGIDLAGVSLSSGKAHSRLGWKAETDLRTGLRATWQWFQECP